MTRLAMCGWESGNANEAGMPYFSTGGSCVQSVDATGPRNGTYALQCYASNSPGKGVSYIFFPLPTEPAEVYIRFGVKYFNTFTANRFTLLGLYDGSTLQIGVCPDQVGPKVGVYRGTTLLGTVPMLSETWTCVEMRVKIHSSAGVVTVWYNGVQVFDFSGNTQSSANAKTNGVIIGVKDHDEYFIGKVYVDDFAINDTTGSVNNSRIGQGGIFPLFPTADTTVTSLTPSTGTDHYALVDENPPSDADYVQANTPGYQDLYALADLATAAQIDAVAVTGRMLAVNGAGAPATLVARSGASITNLTTRYLDGSARYFTDIMETDPNGTIPWTLAAVNSLQVGVAVL